MMRKHRRVHVNQLSFIDYFLGQHVVGHLVTLIILLICIGYIGINVPTQSYCGFKWNNGTLEIHVCSLKPEHEGNHYCYLWHYSGLPEQYKCKGRQHVNKQ